MPKAAIIITRPEAEAKTMAAELEAHDVYCIVSPLMYHKTLTNNIIPVKEWRGIIISSPRAFVVSNLLDFKSLPLWVVGTQTEKMAKQLGWEGPIYEYQHVHDIKIALENLNNGPYLYLCGRHVSQDLTSRNIFPLVTYEVVHEGEWTQEAQDYLRSGKPVLFPVLSERSAKRLEDSLLTYEKHHWSQWQMIVLSEKIAMSIASIVPGGLYWPQVPTHAALIELLLTQWDKVYAQTSNKYYT